MSEEEDESSIKSRLNKRQALEATNKKKFLKKHLHLVTLISFYTTLNFSDFRYESTRMNFINCNIFSVFGLL